MIAQISRSRFRRETWWIIKQLQIKLSSRVPSLIRRYTCYKIQMLTLHHTLGRNHYYRTRILSNKTILKVFIIKELPPWRNPRHAHIQHLANRAAHLKPTRIQIPKPGTTETRPLTVPPVPLRALLKLHNLVLRPLFHTIPQSQHGYRPRFNRITAWQSLLRQWDKYTYVIEFDIRKFFDHVDKRALRSTLLDLGLPQSTIRLITNGKYIDKASDTIKEQEQGILQGYPTSPLLALIALHKVIRIHESDTYTYLGYADDGLLFINPTIPSPPPNHEDTNPTIPSPPPNHEDTTLTTTPHIPYLLIHRTLYELTGTLHRINLTLKAPATRLIKIGPHALDFTFLGIQRSSSGQLTINSRSGLFKGTPLANPLDLLTFYKSPAQPEKKRKPRILTHCFPHSRTRLTMQCAQMRHHLRARKTNART
jgi:hypothetical protein